MKLLKFGAVWCNGCLVMKPRMKQIETENPWLVTEYFDFDEAPETVKQYNIDQERLPVFVFLDKTGRELTRKSGEVEKEEMIRLINEYGDR